MATTYDLLVQPPVQPGLLDVPQVEAALLSAGAVAQPDGTFSLRVTPLVRSPIELRWVKEDGLTRALDCRVPLSDQTDVLEAVLAWAVPFTAALGLVLMDPQLNGTLTSPHSSAVQDEFLRAARYAGEYTGVSDAVGASTLADLQEGSSTTTRLLLAFFVFAAVLYATYSVLLQRQFEDPPSAVPSGPPPRARQ